MLDRVVTVLRRHHENEQAKGKGSDRAKGFDWLITVVAFSNYSVASSLQLLNRSITQGLIRSPLAGTSTYAIILFTT